MIKIVESSDGYVRADFSSYSKMLYSLYKEVVEVKDEVNSLDIESSSGSVLDNCYSYLGKAIKSYKFLTDKCEEYSACASKP